MIKLCLSIVLSLYLIPASAQVLCVQCYDQFNRVSTSVTNLISNGGFENHNCIPQNWFSSSYCPNSNFYNCDINNWVCTGGGSSTYADIVTSAYSRIAEGTYACYFGSHYANFCSQTADDTSCLVDFGCTLSGVPQGFPTNDIVYGGSTGLSLSQTVSGLTPGNIYVLEFWAGGEGQSLNGIFAVDVGFGDTLLHNMPTPGNNSTGIRYIIQFAATSPSQTIRFTNWGHMCFDCTELILDDVRIYPVTELSSIIPACALNTSEKVRDEMNIFYSPQNKYLNVNQVTKRITVFNLTAEKLLSTTDASRLNLSELPDGFYVYECVTGGGRVIRNSFIKY